MNAYNQYLHFLFYIRLTNVCHNMYALAIDRANLRKIIFVFLKNLGAQPCFEPLEGVYIPKWLIVILLFSCLYPSASARALTFPNVITPYYIINHDLDFAFGIEPKR